MCSVVKLRSGGYAWVWCAIGSAVKSAGDGKTLAKSPPPEQPPKTAGYKPFADLPCGKMPASYE